MTSPPLVKISTVSANVTGVKLLFQVIFAPSSCTPWSWRTRDAIQLRKVFCLRCPWNVQMGIIRNLTVSKWDLKWFYKPKLLQLNFLPALPVRVRRSHLGNVRLETCREQVMSQPNVTVVGVARKQRNWEGHQGRAHIWNLGLMFFDPKAPLFEAYFPTYLLTHLPIWDWA